MVSQTTWMAKSPKLLFCCCIKLEPLAYLFHIFNFVGSTTFVGLYFLFVADEYGWIDGMLHNAGGYWYAYFFKIVFCLSLVAVVLCWLSLALVRAMEKRPKFLFAYLCVMYLLNIMAVLTIAVTTVVRFRGSGFEVYRAFTDRLFIYVGWVLSMLLLGRCYFKVKSAEEFERMMEAMYELHKTPE